MKKALQAAIFILVLLCFAALALGGILFARPPQDTAVGRFAREPQVRPVRELVIVDSRGKVLGATVGGASVHKIPQLASNDRARPTVLLQVGQQLVAVEVARDRFYPSSVFFEAANCLGSPWIWLGVDPLYDPPGLLPASAVAPPGQTLYVQTPGSHLEVRTRRSFLRPDGTCGEAEPFLDTAVAAQPLVDLDTVFTPPFSLKTMP